MSNNELKSHAPPQLSLPRWRQAHDFVNRPFSFLRFARRKCGPDFQLHLPGAPAIFVLSSSEAISAVVAGHRGKSPAIDRGDVYQRALDLLPRDLLMRLTGDRYRQMRQHYGKLFEAAMTQLSSEYLKDVFRESARAVEQAGVTDIRRLAETLGYRISLGAAFGDASRCARRAYSRRFDLLRPGTMPNLLSGIAASPLRMLPIAACVLRERRRLRGMLRGWESDPPPTALGDAYRRLQASSEPGSIRLSDLANVMLILRAASTSVLEHALFYLAREDEARHVLQQAVRRKQDNRRALLAAFAAEVRRMCPGTIGFMRIVRRPLEIGRWRLPSDAGIIGCSYLAHRNPAVFAQPNRFCLERFVNKSYAPYEYFPFGVGPHRCLGARYATELTSGIVAAAVQTYDLELMAGRHNRVAQTLGIVTRRSRPTSVRWRKAGVARAGFVAS